MTEEDNLHHPSSDIINAGSENRADRSSSASFGDTDRFLFRQLLEKSVTLPKGKVRMRRFAERPLSLSFKLLCSRCLRVRCATSL